MKGLFFFQIRRRAGRVPRVRKRKLGLGPLKGDINVQSIRSTNNLADLFTKALPTATFERLVHSIGMRRLRDLK